MRRLIEPIRPEIPARERCLPVLVSRDPLLVDDVLRLAAVVGIEMTVAASIGAIVPEWTTAPLVILDAEVMTDDRPGLSRRPDVVIVGRAAPDAATWQAAVEVGATQVLTIPLDEPIVATLLSDASHGPARGTALAVVGGRGGVGASSLAVATALASVRAGARTVLVDLDQCGGGIDLVLRAEDVEGLRWRDLEPIEGRLAPDALVHALPTIHGLSFLSCARHGDVLDPAQVDVVLGAALRAFDVVVLDLPRGLEGAAEVGVRHANLTAVVVAADVRGCAAAQALIEQRLTGSHQVHTVVRSGPGRSVDPHEAAAAAGAPLIAVLREDPRAPGHYERGETPSLRGRSVWAAPAQALLNALGVAPSVQAAS